MAREAEIFYSETSVADMLLNAGSKADQRKARGLRHSLGNVLICLVCAFLTGINSLRGTARWIREEKTKAQLESFLTLNTACLLFLLFPVRSVLQIMQF